MKGELEEILRDAKAWEKVKTNIAGLKICKMPPRNEGGPPSLAVVINPVDEAGKRKKKNDLYIRSMNDLQEFKELICSEKTEKIVELMDEVNPGNTNNEERVLEF